MYAFNPIMFDNCRYCAISKDGYYFVADAYMRDYQHNKRATIIGYGKLVCVQSLVSVVLAYSNQYEYEFVEPSLWMLEIPLAELICLAETYIASLIEESTIEELADRTEWAIIVDYSLDTVFSDRTIDLMYGIYSYSEENEYSYYGK